jgi:hypothetical protein
MAADLQQVREQRLEPLQLALQQLGAAPGSGIEVALRPEQNVGRDPDCGQRCAQFVRDVGHELPLRLGKLFQFAELLLQARGHVVERVGQCGKVVGARGRHPLVKVARRQPARRLRRLPQWHHHPPRDQRDDDRQQHDERNPRGDERVLDEVQRLDLRGEWEEVVELVVPGDRHTHRERGPGGLAIGTDELGQCGVEAVRPVFLLLGGDRGAQLRGDARRQRLVSDDAAKAGDRVPQDHDVVDIARAAARLQLIDEQLECGRPAPRAAPTCRAWPVRRPDRTRSG